MFRDAGANMKVFLDYEQKQIRVQTNMNAGALSWCHPQWEEVASFTDSEGWRKSSFARQVTDETMQTAITWFWIDMEPQQVQSQS